MQSRAGAIARLQGQGRPSRRRCWPLPLSCCCQPQPRPPPGYGSARCSRPVPSRPCSTGPRRGARTTTSPTPARAFRDPLGRIQLTSPHWDNYRMLGRSFDTLKMNCTKTSPVHSNPDPSASTTRNGSQCPTRWTARESMPSPTWSIREAPSGSAPPASTSSASTRGSIFRFEECATSYTHATPPNHLVASTPYQYFKDEGPTGS